MAKVVKVGPVEAPQALVRAPLNKAGQIWFFMVVSSLVLVLPVMEPSLPLQEIYTSIQTSPQEVLFSYVLLLFVFL